MHTLFSGTAKTGGVEDMVFEKDVRRMHCFKTGCIIWAFEKVDAAAEPYENYENRQTLKEAPALKIKRQFKYLLPRFTVTVLMQLLYGVFSSNG